MTKSNISWCVCTNCQHKWLPRKESKPIQCPYCRTVKWDAVRDKDGKIIKDKTNE